MTRKRIIVHCDCGHIDETWHDCIEDARRIPRPQVIHHSPLEDSGLTPCCHVTPFELPLLDRITTDASLVTCPGTERTKEADTRTPHRSRG